MIGAGITQLAHPFAPIGAGFALKPGISDGGKAPPPEKFFIAVFINAFFVLFS
jgi:hypothetical protein